MNDNFGGFQDNSGVMRVYARTFKPGSVEQHWYFDRIAGTWQTTTY
ncbi:hypothetical protein ACFV2Q_35990 [Streptomyces sp. NPDC059650]